MAKTTASIVANTPDLSATAPLEGNLHPSAAPDWPVGGSSSTSPGPESSTGFKKLGWATVGPSSVTEVTSTSASTSGSRAPAVNPPQHHPNSPYASAPPSFQSGGWSSLDAGNQLQSTPTAFPPTAPSRPSHPSSSKPAGFSHGTWAAVSPASQEGPSQIAGQATEQAMEPTLPLQPPKVPEAKNTSTQPAKKASHRDHEVSRSGWQQFKAGGRRK